MEGTEPASGEGTGADVWSRLADLYDLQIFLERAALEALVDLLGAGPETRVLDLATGTGGVLRQLATRPAAPEGVVGTDRSTEMLRRVPELPEGWELCEADATELPFEKGSFDRVTAAYLLHLLPLAQRSRVLAEAHRVLVPGGLLGTVTVAPPTGVLERAIRTPLAKLGGLLGGALQPLDPTDELRAAGFEPLAARRTRRGYPSLSVVARRR